MAFRVAVVGATGLTGTQILNILAERNFPISDLTLFASPRSAGKKIPFKGGTVTVQALDDRASFAGIDLAFFAVSSALSREWAPRVVEQGAIVIDEGSAFRMDPDVPLVIPEVNPEALATHKGIIASPNCSTIQLVMVLHALRSLAPLRRVLVSTYQAVSGTGTDALAELDRQIQGASEPQVYPKPIAFNVLPHCDVFMEDDYTKEELKLTYESRKILADPSLKLSATAVRVPVRIGHSETVLVEFEREVDAAAVRERLAQSPGIRVIDEPRDGGYPTPLDVAGRDEVFVGRIRRDLSSDTGIWLWIVADNLRKGAALNAVQIAEQMQARQLLAS